MHWGYLSGLVAVVAELGVLAASTALQREYVRTLLMVYSRPNSVFRADTFYVGALLVGALLAAFGPRPGVLWAVGGVVAAGWLGAAARGVPLRRIPAGRAATPRRSGAKCVRSAFGPAWGP